MAMATIGLVGLGVMGENLALNLEERGFPVALFNRTAARVDALLAREPGKRLFGCRTLEELARRVERPRKILLMVPAGEPVDATLAQLRPHLEAGDIAVDGGNSHFRDTERRQAALAEAGIHLVGLGVSGGAEGARHGPSLMPGGPREAVAALLPVLDRIAARTEEGPCVGYLGPGGAGHYVKMVHNGIEYGFMQLIAETYDLLKRLGGLDAPALEETFARWNERELQSYLVEITAAIFAARDAETGEPLVERIVDAAAQKGTGRWTAQEALELGVAVPTLAAGVEARALSADRSLRAELSRCYPDPAGAPAAARERLVAQAEAALHAGQIVCYAQGMALLAEAGRERGYGFDLAEVARVWKGGCIIRARLLDRIRRATRAAPALRSLLLDPEIAAALRAREPEWRETVALAARAGLPTPALAASLAYFDQSRAARLPANLIQAQRDYFGAHGYRRDDREGEQHTEWPRGERET